MIKHKVRERPVLPETKAELARELVKAWDIILSLDATCRFYKEQYQELHELVLARREENG